MISFVAVLQSQNPVNWLLSNWPLFVGIIVVIAFLYFFTAFMLDLRLPFESKAREDDPPGRDGTKR